jgi:hypothetical protein
VHRPDKTVPLAEQAPTVDELQIRSDLAPRVDLVVVAARPESRCAASSVFQDLLHLN